MPKKTVKAFLERHPRLNRIVTLPKILRWHLKGRRTISLNYPVTPAARYGHGKPPHRQLYELIARKRDQYRETLKGFLGLKRQLLAIALEEPPDSARPCWAGSNTWVPFFDAVALYGFLATRRPKTYIEIGSGYSTRFARRAFLDHALPTELISIDPHPRAQIDSLCDRVFRRRLEETDLGIFATLQAGDVLYMDGSHRCFMNSDATVFFLEVLPQLAAGVVVQVHDILLPYDYPPKWQNKWYSEQYLLAAALLAKDDASGILLPNAFVTGEPDLASVLDPLREAIGLPEDARGGGAFWMVAGPGNCQLVSDRRGR